MSRPWAHDEIPGAQGYRNEQSGSTDPSSPDDDDLCTHFPFELLPETAQQMAREIARVTTSSNESLAGVSVIGTIAAALGGGIQILSGGERITRGNLYSLCIAASGTGKGETFSIATAPFYAAQEAELLIYNKETRPQLEAELKIAEKRSKGLAAKAANENDPDKRASLTKVFSESEAQVLELQKKLGAKPIYAVADVTKEALAIAMASQPHEALSSISSEARGIFSIVKGRYGKEGGDEEFYCSTYSGDVVIHDRVNRGRIHLSRPCLNILWMVQPDIARSSLSDEALVESGFLARFLIVDSNAEPQLRESAPGPIPATIKKKWADLISSLIKSFRNNSGEPLSVTAEPGANKVLHEYEEEAKRLRRPGGEHQDIKAYVARWAENAWRLALVFHATKHGIRAGHERLAKDTAEAAIGIMRWFNECQLRVLAADRNDRASKRLLAVLAVLAEHDGSVSVRDFSRSYGFKQEEIEQLCQKYPHKVVIQKTTAGIGRPSAVVRAV